jgi:hypothetical protein
MDDTFIEELGQDAATKNSKNNTPQNFAPL